MMIFSKGYVDMVIKGRVDKDEAKRFLMMQLEDAKNEITAKHYEEIKQYIKEQ